MGTKLKILAVSLAVLMAGCSSTYALNYGQTWDQFGYDLAMRGNRMIEPERLEEVNLDEYKQGYVRGLKEFCQQDGYQLGLSGLFYEGTCDSINPEFSKQYELGYVDFEISQQNYDWEQGTYEPSIDSFDY